MAARLRKDAIDLARAGPWCWRSTTANAAIVTVGWFGPAHRPQGLQGSAPETAEIRELRAYVDPTEQTEDWFNAINYVVSQAMVDIERIGIRGSSYPGGFVVYVAARAPRVKVIVSQVGAFDGRQQTPYRLPAEALKADGQAGLLATRRASYPGEGLQTKAMEGAPVGNKYLRWALILDAGRITQPILFIVSEK